MQTLSKNSCAADSENIFPRRLGLDDFLGCKAGVPTYAAVCAGFRLHLGYLALILVRCVPDSGFTGNLDTFQRAICDSLGRNPGFSWLGAALHLMRTLSFFRKIDAFSDIFHIRRAR